MFKSLCAADNLLEPTKPSSYSSYKPETLDKTRPMLRGTFVFRDPNSDIQSPHEMSSYFGKPTPSNQTPTTSSTLPPSLIVILVDWIRDNDGLYEKSPPRFFRLEQGAKAPLKHMDINLLELGE